MHLLVTCILMPKTTTNCTSKCFFSLCIWVLQIAKQWLSLQWQAIPYIIPLYHLPVDAAWHHYNLLILYCRNWWSQFLWHRHQAQDMQIVKQRNWSMTSSMTCKNVKPLPVVPMYCSCQLNSEAKTNTSNILQWYLSRVSRDWTIIPLDCTRKITLHLHVMWTNPTFASARSL